MLQDFLNGNIMIVVTQEDFNQLKEVADVTGLTFNSGDSLYEGYMYRLLSIYKSIRIMKARHSKSVILEIKECTPKPSVTVSEFLISCREDKHITNEFMALLES